MWPGWPRPSEEKHDPSRSPVGSALVLRDGRRGSDAAHRRIGKQDRRREQAEDGGGALGVDVAVVDAGRNRQPAYRLRLRFRLVDRRLTFKHLLASLVHDGELKFGQTLAGSN